MKKHPPAVPFQDFFNKLLRNPERASSMLATTQIEGDLEGTKLILSDLIKLNGGFTQVAKKAGVSRASLYHMVSKKGNPELQTMYKLGPVLNFTVAIVPHLPKAKAA
jgi:probable addiction module antidote protein